jgi:phage terminase large subunit-like protein
MTPRRNTSRARDPVERYAREVLEGKIIAGPLVRLACARHLRDFEQQKERGLVWRRDRALHQFGFFRDVLRLNGGEFEGKPFELVLWQQFVVGSLFGWYGADGYRRFRVSYCEVGKGNGKSPLAAGIGLSMMIADNEPRAEVYSAAVGKDQAGILFKDAVAMVDLSPELSRRIVKSGSPGKEWNLAHLQSGSFFRPLASEHRGRGKSGPRPHCSLLDEVHEHPSNAMVEFSRAGTKGRKQALSFMITNSGFDRHSVCWHYHEYAERVLRQEIEDDSFFAYVCALDPEDDWRDELCWLKANPNLGVSIEAKYLREQVREAIGMPSKQSIVKRLNFCVWVDAESPWIDGEAWRACVTTVDAAQLVGKAAYGGLDLSGKNDLTALVLVIPDGETVWSLAFFWSPAEGLIEREERDRVPYSVWKREGHLRTTPGRSIDYAFAARQVQIAMGEFGLCELAFDRWRIDDFSRELDELGIEYEVVDFGKQPERSPELILRPHGQGFKDMGPAVDLLETDILNGTLKVISNPIMNMCSANAVLVSDPAGSRKFDKRSARGRIDGVVALAMARRCATLAGSASRSFWE